MSEVIIRQSCNADRNELLDVTRKSWLYTYPCNQLGITLNQLRKLDFLLPLFNPELVTNTTQAVLHPDYHIGRLVAVTHEAKIVGGIKIEKFCDDIYKLVSLYVHPDYMKQGIGTQLMNKVLNKLKHAKTISLEVATYTYAVCFYRQFGFEIVTESCYENIVLNEQYLPAGTLNIPTFIMQKNH